MSSGMTSNQRLAILKRDFGQVVYTPPSTWYVGLSLTDITDTGLGVTEPLVGGYARVAVTNSAGNFAVVSGQTAMANNVSVEFPRSTANWGEVRYVALYAAATGGQPLYYGRLTNAKQVQVDDSLFFEPGALAFYLTAETAPS